MNSPHPDFRLVGQPPRKNSLLWLMLLWALLSVLPVPEDAQAAESQWVIVHVFQSSGLPLSNTTVTLKYPDGGTWKETSNLTGIAYFFNVLPGTYKLAIEGYRDQTVVVGSKTLMVTFGAKADAQTLAVTAYQSSGLPLSNTTVTLKYPDGSTRKRISDSSGAATFFNVLPGIYKLAIEGYRDQTVVVGSKRVTVSFGAKAESQTLAVKAYQSSGLPLTNTTVTLKYPDGSTRKEISDSSGDASFRNVLPGTYKLAIEGYRDQTITVGSKTLTVSFGAQAESQTLYVKAFQSGGLPLTNTTVTLKYPDGITRKETSDLNGDASFLNVLPGTYKLAIEGYRDQTITVGSKTLFVSFGAKARWTTLAVKAHQSTGRPFGNTTITLKYPDGSTRKETSNSSGVAHFFNVLPGAYKLAIEGYRDQSITVSSGSAILSVSVMWSEIGISLKGIDPDEFKSLTRRSGYTNRYAVILGAANPNFPLANESEHTTFKIAIQKDVNAIYKLLTTLDNKFQPLEFEPKVRDKHAIQSALDRVRSIATKQDQVIIYFSGHAVEIDGKGFLVPFAADVSRPQQTYFPMEKFRDLSRTIAAKSLIVILDTCNSGLAGKSFVSKGRPEDQWIDDMTRLRAHILLTAGTSDQQAIADVNGSLYTTVLIERLRSLFDRGEIAVGDSLIVSVSQEVNERSRNYYNHSGLLPQKFNLPGHEEGDFFIFP